MITTFIRFEIEPTAQGAFARYARAWGDAVPRCGAQLIGYFGPHEDSTTTAYGVNSVADLASYEAYRARLRVFRDYGRDDRARAPADSRAAHGA